MKKILLPLLGLFLIGNLTFGRTAEKDADFLTKQLQFENMDKKNSSYPYGNYIQSSVWQLVTLESINYPSRDIIMPMIILKQPTPKVKYDPKFYLFLKQYTNYDKKISFTKIKNLIVTRQTENGKPKKMEFKNINNLLGFKESKRIYDFISEEGIYFFTFTPQDKKNKNKEFLLTKEQYFSIKASLGAYLTLMTTPELE